MGEGKENAPQVTYSSPPKQDSNRPKTASDTGFPATVSGMLKNLVPHTSSGRHIDCLDGLRGIAILMVILCHSAYYNPDSRSLLQYVGRLAGAGWMGVPIFFVLSGFLISYPMFVRKLKCERRLLPEGYAMRRIAKIVPPYYLSLVVFALWFHFVIHKPGVFAAAARYAAGIPNFIPEESEFNGSYWSLLVECQFYVVLPLLFAALRRLDYRPMGLAIFVSLTAVPWLARWLVWRPGPDPGQVPFLMNRFPCRLDYFAWGVLFAWLFEGKLLAGLPRRPLACLGYAGVAALLILIITWTCLVQTERIDVNPTLFNINAFQFGLGLAAFLMLFFVFDPALWGSRLLCLPWLRYTGIISYEWFLFHMPVAFWFRSLVGNASGSIFKFMAIILVPNLATYAFAALLYHYFSFPILLALRRVAEPKKPGLLDKPAVQ